jgi:hypothetical protein
VRDWYRIGQETRYYGWSFHAFGCFVHQGRIVDTDAGAARETELPAVDSQKPRYVPPVTGRNSWTVTVETPLGSLRTQASQALALELRLRGHGQVLGWYGPAWSSMDANGGQS